jgi:hypothetical protein
LLGREGLSRDAIGKLTGREEITFKTVGKKKETKNECHCINDENRYAYDNMEKLNSKIEVDTIKRKKFDGRRSRVTQTGD